MEAGAGEGLASDEPDAPEEAEGEEAEGAPAEPPELRSSPAPALLPEEGPLAALALPAEARESPRPLPSELPFAAAPFAEDAAVEAPSVPAPSEVAPIPSLTDTASPKAPSVPAPPLSAPSSPPNPPAKRLWVEDASPSGKAPPVPGRIPGATSKSNESVRPAKEMAPRAAPAKSRRRDRVSRVHSSLAPSAIAAPGWPTALVGRVSGDEVGSSEAARGVLPRVPRPLEADGRGVVLVDLSGMIAVFLPALAGA